MLKNSDRYGVQSRKVAFLPRRCCSLFLPFSPPSASGQICSTHMHAGACRQEHWPTHAAHNGCTDTPQTNVPSQAERKGQKREQHTSTFGPHCKERAPTSRTTRASRPPTTTAAKVMRKHLAGATCAMRHLGDSGNGPHAQTNAKPPTGRQSTILPHDPPKDQPDAQANSMQAGGGTSSPKRCDRNAAANEVN